MPDEAIRELLNHMQKMAECTARYLASEIDQKQFVDEIIGLIDGPEQRRVEQMARDAIAGIRASGSPV